MVEKNDYVKKTYRYLRISIVAMVLALLISIGIEYRVTGTLLGAISAYYYTPANPIFVGALIMIGVCLIAIRGEFTFDEVVLNLAGMLAPVVALVPTAFPNPGSYDEARLFEPNIQLLTSNTVPAMMWAAAIVVVVTLFALGVINQWNKWSRDAKRTLGIGLTVVIIGVIALIVIHSRYGSQWAHNVAAVGTFAGLWAVATASAVRSTNNAWKTGIGGSLVALGAVLFIGGLVRMIDGATLGWVALVGIAMLAIALGPTNLRGDSLAYFGVLGKGTGYQKLYLLIAISMLTVGPFMAAVPGEWAQRTFWIEIAELVPFAIFWIVQTVELWDEGVRVHPATPGT